VNRTPVTSPIEAFHSKADLCVSGCGLSHRIPVGRSPVRVVVNIETPYMPITSDGKAPDLGPFLGDIADLAGNVARKAKRQPGGAGRTPTQKEVTLGCLDEAVAKASEGGRYRFSLRQLFYAVRPRFIEAIGKEPDYGYFSTVISDF